MGLYIAYYRFNSTVSVKMFLLKSFFLGASLQIFSVSDDASDVAAPEDIDSELPPADCEEEANPYDNDRWELVLLCPILWKYIVYHIGKYISYKDRISVQCQL